MGSSLLACAYALLALPAAAQVSGVGSEPATSSSFNFEDDAIEGELILPAGALLSTAPPLPNPPDLDGSIRALIDRAVARTIDAPGRLELAQLLVARSRRRMVRAVRLMDQSVAALHRGDRAEHERLRREEERWFAAEARDRRAALVQLGLIPTTVGRPTLHAALELRLFLLSEPDADEAKADAVARLIVKTFPDTALAAVAHVQLADRSFAQASLNEARAAYDAAIAVPSASPVIVSYALYKRAWVEFNASEFSAALQSFEAARRAAVAAGPQGRSLRREAANDIVRVLATLTVEPTEAIETIQRLGDSRERRVRLAARYETMLRDAGRESDAQSFAQAFARVSRHL